MCAFDSRLEKKKKKVASQKRVRNGTPIEVNRWRCEENETSVQ